jgi:LysM repeat protein
MSLLMTRDRENRPKTLQLSIALGTLAFTAMCGVYYFKPDASLYPPSRPRNSAETLPGNPAPRQALPIPDRPAPKWTLPIPDHPAVDTWVRRFSEKYHTNFQIQLDHAHSYLAPAQKIFLHKGLPKDLVYVALIESGFSPAARSHAKAVGMWQILSKTGTSFGLEQNDGADERAQPMKAAQAAADYLSSLYDHFGSWSLALAAYNAGESSVQEALDESGLKTFWDLLESGRLPAETRDYVPKLFATVKIVKNPKFYGFRQDSTHSVARQSSVPTSYDVRPGDTLSALARKLKCSVAALVALNKLDPSQPLKVGQPLKVPAGAPLQYPPKAQKKPRKAGTPPSSPSRKSLSSAHEKAMPCLACRGDTLLP